MRRMLLALLLALAVVAPASAATRVGRDVYGVKVADLQATIDAATTGATIYLGPGTYTGAITISHQVNLVGEGPDLTKFTGAILVATSNVVLSGFSVRNPAGAYGVKLYAAGTSISRVTLNNLWIGASSSGAGDGPVVGLWLEDAILNEVDGCTIAFCTGDGVYLHATLVGTNVNRFENCTMNGNGTGGTGYGVDIVGGSIEGTEIVSGTMEDNVTGEVNASSTNNLMIRGVDFERVTACTNILTIATSGTVSIDDCNFLGNGSVTRAFLLSTCTSPQVSRCTFSTGFPASTAIGIFDQNTYNAREFGNVLNTQGTYISDRGGRLLGAEPQLKTAWQPRLSDFTGNLWLPNAAGTGAGFGPVWTASGTVSSPTPASTHSTAAWVRRNAYTSTGANQEIGVKLTAASDCSFWTGDSTGYGGFYFAATFRLDDWSNSARLFVGLASNAAGAPALADLAGLTGDFVGLYHQTTDGANTVKIVSGHATVNAVIALANSGSGPIVDNGQAFRFEMRCPPGPGLISCTLTSLNTNSVVGWAQVNTPSSTVFMAPQVEIGNAASGNRVLGVANVYVTGTGR